MPVTERQLRAATWTLQFEHDNFRAHTTDVAPGMALLHDNGKIAYRVKGKGTTDSLSQATRWWNDNEKKLRADGGYVAPGSVDQIRQKRAGL